MICFLQWRNLEFRKEEVVSFKIIIQDRMWEFVQLEILRQHGTGEAVPTLHGDAAFELIPPFLLGVADLCSVPQFVFLWKSNQSELSYCEQFSTYINWTTLSIKCVKDKNQQRRSTNILIKLGKCINTSNLKTHMYAQNNFTTISSHISQVLCHKTSQINVT